MGKGMTAIEAAIQKKLRSEEKGEKKGEQLKVRLSLLKDNPYQPRLEYDKAELEILANTIRENGLLQPIPVIKDGKEYIIVAGHRRKRAFELLGESKIPAILLKEMSKQDLMVLAAIENLARVDLDIVEEAKSYYDMIASGIPIKELSKKLGVSESTISRKQNLLKLSEVILEDIRENQSTKDVTALTLLRKITDTQKQEELYFMFLEKGRAWLRQEIQNCACAIPEENDNESMCNSILRGTKRIFSKEKISKLPTAKLEKINKMLNEIEKVISDK